MKKKIMVVLMAMVMLLPCSTVVYAENLVGDDAVTNGDVYVDKSEVTENFSAEEREKREDKASAQTNLTSGNDIVEGASNESAQSNIELQADIETAESEKAIDQNNFPDANFREYVKANFDTDGNGSFSQNELMAVTSIIIPVDSPRIQSLKGIEYFTEITFLSCNENPSLVGLDLSHNTKLQEASVRDCQLNSLKLPTNIKGINCSGNQLTSMDISDTNILFLWCNNNPLTSLITNSTLLFLECNNNQLATLDLSNELEMGLRIYGNQGSPGHHGPMSGAFIGSQSISANTLRNSDVWTVDMTSLVGANYLDRVKIVTEGAVLSSDGIVTFSGSEMPKELVYEFDTRNPAEYTPMAVNVTLSGINVPVTEGVSFNTSGLDMNGICGVNELNVSTDNVEVRLSQEQAAAQDIAKLSELADVHGLSVVASYEITMELLANGSKITDLIENFGVLELTLKVGIDYSGSKATVYQLHNGEEIIVHDGLIVNADGTVTIVADKLSTFTVAVDKVAENAVQPSPEKLKENPVQLSPQKPTVTTPTSSVNAKSPKTGDSVPFIFWGGICVIAMGVLTVYVKRKNSKNN